MWPIRPPQTKRKKRSSLFLTPGSLLLHSLILQCEKLLIRGQRMRPQIPAFWQRAWSNKQRRAGMKGGAGGLIQGITGRELPWRGGLFMGEEEGTVEGGMKRIGTRGWRQWLFEMQYYKYSRGDTPGETVFFQFWDFVVFCFSNIFNLFFQTNREKMSKIHI